MKKVCIFLIVFALAMTGCARADAHPEWDEAWTRFGDILAVEPPEGFALDEFNDTLSMGGIWYGTWVRGQARTVTRADGEEATAYDAQIYLLLKEDKNPAEAEADVADWLEREAQTYGVGPAEQLSMGGQSYTLLPLLSAVNENPYTHGVAAFAARENVTISAEVLCGAGFDKDARAILEEVLSNIHFGR